MKLNQLFSIKDKVVLITGCSSGIGLELSKGFILNGANVIGISKSKPKEKIKFRKFFQCDLNDEEKIDYIVEDFKKNKIFINSILNVAGVSIGQSSSETVLVSFDKTFNTNVRSMFNLIHKLKPCFSENSSIINFSSIGGKLGFPGNPSYCASKGAVISLSRALSVDLGAYNIRVNCIVPGYFHTKMINLSFQNKKEKQIREKRTVLGRWGELNELLGASIFLASDASSYVTGTELIVDGGWSSKGL